MITIYGKLYSSKNSRRIFTKNRRNISLKSENATQEFKSFLIQLADANTKNKWKEMTEGKAYPWRVEFTVYKKTNGRWDFGNSVENISDALTKAGYIPDDNTKYFLPVPGIPQVDKANPRVEIRVL